MKKDRFRVGAAGFWTAKAAVLVACVADQPALVEALDAGADSGSPVDGSADVADGGLDSSTADADADASADAADASVPECDRSKGFGTPQSVTLLGLPNDALAVRLSQQERVAFFYRPASSVLLWTATRTSRTAQFGPATTVPMLAPDAGFDSFPSVDEGSRVLFFGSTRDGVGKIWVSNRPDTVSSFVPPVPLLAGGGRPSTTADGQEVYYQDLGTSLGAAPGDVDIFVVRKSGASFGAPVVALEDGANSDVAPAISPDGLTLYFASTRPDVAKVGGFDVWQMQRASRASAWNLPTIVPSASTAGVDLPTWGSSDGCRLYVSSQTASVFMERPK